MRKHIRLKLGHLLIVTAAVFCAAAGPSVNAQTQFCPLDIISEAYLPEYNRANSVLPSKTVSKISQISLYVTTHGEELYLHSNYAPANARTRRDGTRMPWKLATNDPAYTGSMQDSINVLTDPQQYLVDAFRYAPDAEVTRASHEREVLEAYNKSMRIYVDERVLSHPKYRDLNLGRAKNIIIVRRNGTLLPTLFSSGIAFPRRWVEIRPDRMYADINNLEVIGRLNSTVFRRGDIRVLTLVQDQATLDSAAALVPSKNRMAFDFSSAEALNNLFAQNRGKTVFVIGHIPEGSSRLVVENSLQQEVFSLPLQEIESMARQNNSSLFVLGCNSALATGGPGTLNVINSRDAVKRLQLALGAQNYGDFVNRLAGPNMKIVVSEVLLNGAERRVRFEFGDDILSTLFFGVGVTAGTSFPGLIIYQASKDDDEEVNRVKASNSQSRRRRKHK